MAPTNRIPFFLQETATVILAGAMVPLMVIDGVSRKELLIEANDPATLIVLDANTETSSTLASANNDVSSMLASVITDASSILAETRTEQFTSQVEDYEIRTR